MLADLLGLELVLGDTADGRGDVGDGGAERGVVEVELLLGAGETEVDPSRLIGERPIQ